jgi:endonuclease/exonuclease/phosphatase family metal-dependent hydrolase
MRIIFFNTWHGEVWDKFSKFIVDESCKTDIFCFTEVDPGLKVKLEKILTDHKSFYEKTTELYFPKRETDGHCSFVRKTINVETSGKKFTAPLSKRDVGCFQYINLNLNGKILSVANVHGKSLPGSKVDTQTRIDQSQIIIGFFKNVSGPKIIGGDFNLLPETKSVGMFEEAGYKNLIKEFNIKNTRNKLTWGQYPNDMKQHFADYVFISRDVMVNSFSVPNIEASDHEPLILDFEI